MKISEQTKKKIYIAVIGVCVVAMIVLGIEYRVKKMKAQSDVSVNGPVTTVKTGDSKVLVSVSTETIRDGLANMGTLITQEYYFTQVEKYTKEKTFFQFLTSSSEFIYSYDGAVMAGIDFEKIEIKKDDSAKKLTIVLPKSEIQAVTIDKDTFKIYSEKDSLWNPLKLDDYNVSLSEFEEAAKKKALDSGILERSDEQAQNLVKNFITNFPSASDYEIVFE
ncbi:DUF4230 domain-containing protein [Butyrivibrio sp. X503]|uniref:DUF4230 domain-containing protein n=1 Tax=Butyrivibrio sp. X503 TaxID=2364878 RepID=UPI0013146FB2|nr:DUF4230 domain-containing protein [Butyrivibrio sp. X503]